MSQTEIAAYVRPEGLLPERAPPTSAEGIAARMRRNLFGNLTDTLITLLLAVFPNLGGLVFGFLSFPARQLVWRDAGGGDAGRRLYTLGDRLDEAAAREASADQRAEDLAAEQMRDLGGPGGSHPFP